MCSFLLLFLILVITFSHFQDFAHAADWHLEAKRPAAESVGKATVVLAQNRQNFFDIGVIDTCPEHFLQAPLQRFGVSEQDLLPNPRKNVSGRSIPVGLSVWQTQQEECQPMCPLLGPLVQRHKARCDSKGEVLWSQCSMGQMGWLESRLGRMGERLGRHGKCWSFLNLFKRASGASDRIFPKGSAQGERKGQRQRQKQIEERANRQSLRCGKRWARAIACLALLDQSRGECIAFSKCPIQQKQHHAGDGGTSASGVQRLGSPGRCSSFSGQSRQGVQPQQYQISAGCNEESRSCSESPQRRGQCKERPSSPMDKTRGRRHQDMGGTAGKLQSPSGDPLRTCRKSTIRNRDFEEDLEGSQRELSQGRAPCHPTAYPGRDGGCDHRHCGGCGRAEITRSSPRGPQCMCRITWTPGCLDGATGARGIRGRQGAGSAQQATTFCRTSEDWHGRSQTVTCGREHAVYSNDVH